MSFRNTFQQNWEQKKAVRVAGYGGGYPGQVSNQQDGCLSKRVKDIAFRKEVKRHIY